MTTEAGGVVAGVGGRLCQRARPVARCKTVPTQGLPGPVCHLASGTVSGWERGPGGTGPGSHCQPRGALADIISELASGRGWGPVGPEGWPCSSRRERRGKTSSGSGLRPEPGGTWPTGPPGPARGSSHGLGNGVVSAGGRSAGPGVGHARAGFSGPCASADRSAPSRHGASSPARPGTGASRRLSPGQPPQGRGSRPPTRLRRPQAEPD